MLLLLLLICYNSNIAEEKCQQQLFNEKGVIMCNLEIRQRAKDKGILLWQLADGFGVTDSTFSRQLRREFPDEKRRRALELIEQIAGGDPDV